MILKNNKGFSLIESMILGVLAFIIIGAAISGITWVKSSFQRISKRTVAIEVVSAFSQNLQEQFVKYPNLSINGSPATYVICYDSSIRPVKNSAGGMDPILKSLSSTAMTENTGDCNVMGYEIHLTWTTTPNQYRLVVIGVVHNIGPVYDETISVFKQ